MNISFGYVLVTLIGHGFCGGVRWECALKIRAHERAPSPQLGHDLSTVNLLWFIIAFVSLNLSHLTSLLCKQTKKSTVIFDPGMKPTKP